MKNMKNMSFLSLPTPRSISFLWNMGFLLSMCLILQIVSGLVLSMNYICSIDKAFDSVMHIMRDLDSGWTIRCLHLNGASLFFILIYTHMGRGMFFNSPVKISFVWVSGVLIFILSMMTAFMGYVLPWGQMSYWGATVITSMLTSIPYVGMDLIMWLWGDFSVTEPMLNRMLSLHFLVPMLLTVMVLGHLMILHTSGSSNPSLTNTNLDKVKLFPYFILKDVVPLIFLFSLMAVMICNYPFFLGDPENFSTASIYTTPTHIKPEWYFLFAYAILRCIPSKLGGVLMMLLSFMVMLILILGKKNELGLKYTPHKKLLCYSFFFCMLLLTYMGGKPVNDVSMVAAQLLTLFYFLIIFFLV